MCVHAFDFCMLNTHPSIVKITASSVFLQVQIIKDGVAVIQET